MEGEFFPPFLDSSLQQDVVEVIFDNYFCEDMLSPSFEKLLLTFGVFVDRAEVYYIFFLYANERYSC